MSLSNIVAALGGDLYAGGSEAMIPAPGHSKRDRSVSLKLANGRVVVNSFGGARWQDVLDTLREKGLIDAGNAPASVSTTVTDYHGETRTRAERTQAARAIWTRARALGGTLSELHLRLRGVDGSLPTDRVVRHAESAPLAAYRGSDRTRPALLVAISDASDELTAIEMTYLDPDGRRTTRLRAPRKTVGVMPAGCSVKIDDVGAAMVVGEGFFTTLSARSRFGLPAHALLSIRNFAGWRPPEGVKSVLIAGDNGGPGRTAALGLEARLRRSGLIAEARFPPLQFDDWNAADQAEAL